MATSTKRIETISDDGQVALRTESDGIVSVIDPTMTEDGEEAIVVPESSLLEAVLEYAAARGLRRQRKPRTATARKRTTKPAANGAQAITEI